MTPTHPASARGLTLVEVSIAMTVAALVIVGALAASRAQMDVFHGTQKLRAAQNSARSALLFLETKLASAGYGMDPAHAFDFGTYVSGPCPAELGGCPRDATNDSDELVFYARDPAYWAPADPTVDPRGRAWRFVAADAASLTLRAREGDVFRRGQILQAVCIGEALHAYATVAARVEGPADDGDPNTTTVAEVTIPLEAPAATPDPFHGQDAMHGAMGACFGGGARVFSIDRYRFHVRPVRVGDRWEPYLVLDRGVANDAGEVEEQLVADGVEVFQVAYAFQNTALGLAGGGDAAITLAAGTAASATQTPDAVTMTLFPSAVGLPAGKTPYTESSFTTYTLVPPLPPERLTNHQGNIVAVRLGLVVRAAEPDLGSPQTFPIAGFRLLNFTGASAWLTEAADAGAGDDHHQRVVSQATVLVPNMQVRTVPPF